MKICPHCRAHNPDDTWICPECHKEMTPLGGSDNDYPMPIKFLKLLAWLEMIGSVLVVLIPILKHEGTFDITTSLMIVIQGIAYGIVMLVIAYIAEKVTDIDRKIK